MNNNQVLCYRYAAAFFDLFEKKVTQSDLSAYENAASFLKNNRMLLSFLSLGQREQEQKSKFFLLLCSHFKLSPRVAELAEILSNHGRIILLPDVFRAIIDLYKQKNKIINFTIESSHELDDEDKKRIREWISQQLSKDICEYEYVRNDRLIAGIRIVSAVYGWEQSIARSLRLLAATCYR